ncbi:MAG: chromate resistance protein [Acidimicrobiia bacterium]|nr:chromate resistance protein [Acidimicrobiia bacterium]
MKWATRTGVHVDRAATAWLIRREIDPGAEFIFVEDPDDVPADATAFDMVGATLSHRGDMVTFETVLEDYEITDPAMAAVGRIVHEADVADDLYDAPEAAGLDAIIRGLSIAETDEAILEITRPLFDGLYLAIERRLG